jgi:hypothetical protein
MRKCKRYMALIRAYLQTRLVQVYTWQCTVHCITRGLHGLSAAKQKWGFISSNLANGLVRVQTEIWLEARSQLFPSDRSLELFGSQC